MSLVRSDYWRLTRGDGRQTYHFFNAAAPLDTAGARELVPDATAGKPMTRDAWMEAVGRIGNQPTEKTHIANAPDYLVPDRVVPPVPGVPDTSAPGGDLNFPGRWT